MEQLKRVVPSLVDFFNFGKRQEEETKAPIKTTMKASRGYGETKSMPAVAVALDRTQYKHRKAMPNPGKIPFELKRAAQPQEEDVIEERINDEGFLNAPNMLSPR